MLSGFPPGFVCRTLTERDGVGGLVEGWMLSFSSALSEDLQGSCQHAATSLTLTLA